MVLQGRCVRPFHTLLCAKQEYLMPLVLLLIHFPLFCRGRKEVRLVYVRYAQPKGSLDAASLALLLLIVCFEMEGKMHVFCWHRKSSQNCILDYASLSGNILLSCLSAVKVREQRHATWSGLCSRSDCHRRESAISLFRLGQSVMIR